MRGLVLLISMLVGFAVQLNAQQSIYDFKIKTLEGDDFDFKSLKGKKVMIVNTASKCGFTPQYEKLEKIYKLYGSEKFVIIGFPANNFLNQEPGNATQIREFCTKNYGVSFPIMEKISVKGKDIHPVYQWLTQKVQNGVMDSNVKWNFQKYLINEEGKLVRVIPPSTSPDELEIINWIKGLE
jgi:glutathione peroxidase